MGSGVSVYDGSTWTHYMPQDGLLCENVFDLACDTRGFIWAAHDWSYVSGVSVFDGVSWDSLTCAEDGVPRYAVSIAADHSGGVWFGLLYGTGFAYMNGGWVDFLSDAPGCGGPVALDSNGGVWYCHSRLCYFDRLNWHDLGDAPLSNSYPKCRDTAVDAIGSVWKCNGDDTYIDRQPYTGQGVASYDGADWEVFAAQTSGLGSNCVWNIAPSLTGEVWGKAPVR